MKYVTIDSFGYLPTLGGICGPIKNPIKLTEEQIFQLLKTQKKVFEVKSPKEPNNKVQLSILNYNKNNFPEKIPEEVKNEEDIIQPPVPVQVLTQPKPDDVPINDIESNDANDVEVQAQIVSEVELDESKQQDDNPVKDDSGIKIGDTDVSSEDTNEYVPPMVTSDVTEQQEKSPVGNENEIKEEEVAPVQTNNANTNGQPKQSSPKPATSKEHHRSTQKKYSNNYSKNSPNRK